MDREEIAKGKSQTEEDQQPVAVVFRRRETAPLDPREIEELDRWSGEGGPGG